MLDLALPVGPDDDGEFLAWVTRIVVGSVAVHRPEEVRITKIDRWFDHKWLHFSGKVVGALGVWNKSLTVPPFVRNRIALERRFTRDDAADRYAPTEPVPGLHFDGPSSANTWRSVRKVAPTAALFWYSGGTLTSGRGSLMAHMPIDNGHWAWFLAFARDPIWRVMRRKDIHDYEVRLFERSGANHGSSACVPENLPS